MKTNATLLSAIALMAEYSRVTDAHIRIYDHKYEILHELPAETGSSKNFCLSCTNSNDECYEKMIAAIKEAQRLEASHRYTCPLGFDFFISPIYFNGSFTGALLGGSFCKNDAEKNKSLAELMFFCAQSLSAENGNATKLLKRGCPHQLELSAKIEKCKKENHTGKNDSIYPLSKEKELLENLRSGQSESGKKILIDILASAYCANPSQFKNVQSRAIELAVLMCRIGADSGFTAKTMLENNSRYIKTILETKNMYELSDTLCRIIDDLLIQLHSFQGVDHASALKKAEDFIMENLSRKISLEEIARASGFSAPYFSTIFKLETGENLTNYLTRLRVDKAINLLLETNLPLSNIAGACGFEDQSWFSKIFKQLMGISPGKYRFKKGKKSQKIPEIGFSEELSWGADDQ